MGVSKSKPTMSVGEKFCLKWNQFQENVSQSFRELRDNNDFFDVTLACEDDQQIEAHKVILSACSPFFRNILKKNPHSHPLLYMKNVKMSDLVSILDFIYHGETNVHQEDLDVFLATAKEMKLKGLTEESDSIKSINTERPELAKKVANTPINDREGYMKHYTDNVVEEKFDNTLSVIDTVDESLIDDSLIDNSFNYETTSNDETIQEMMVSTEEGLQCKTCGKLSKTKQNLRKHIETHLPSASHPCTYCGKIYRSTNSLQSHISRQHGQ